MAEKISEKQLEQALRDEGFSHVYVRQAGPKATYPEHTHATATAHVILEGEMTLALRGISRTCKSGERCDVPANEVHSAKMGPRGCRYLIGEK
jgi:quercetin dioxygenase-like cupin family protein